MTLNVGSNLKTIREEHGFTQEQLAEAVGVRQSMIAQIERGTKALTIVLGAEIAGVLHCRLDDIAYGEHTEKNNL